MRGKFQQIVLPSIISILLLSLIIHAAGTWPIIYLVKSGSMEPTVIPGDVIIVKSTDPNDLDPGSIIVFDVPGSEESPYVHRIVRWVNKGEPMWSLGPPAPYSGFITKGDNNKYFDQASVESIGPVEKDWVKGEVEFVIRMSLQPPTS